MIRDNVIPAARWRVPPESDDVACQRVAELCATSLLGLTFTVYASVGQLQKALEDGAGFRSYEEKLVADSGAWSRVWTIKVVNKDKTIYKLWLWQTNRDVTVICAALEQTCGGKGKDKFKEILGTDE